MLQLLPFSLDVQFIKPINRILFLCYPHYFTGVILSESKKVWLNSAPRNIPTLVFARVLKLYKGGNSWSSALLQPQKTVPDDPNRPPKHDVHRYFGDDVGERIPRCAAVASARIWIVYLACLRCVFFALLTIATVVSLWCTGADVYSSLVLSTSSHYGAPPSMKLSHCTISPYRYFSPLTL